jgi:transcriptional regulator with XRE-family HTH domain
MPELQQADDLAAWDWRAELRAQGRSVAWLARRLDVAQVTLHRYANGSRKPSTPFLRAVARELGKGPS